MQTMHNPVELAMLSQCEGEIPVKNERIDYGRYVFEIIAADNRRIKKVKLYIKEDDSKETE